MSHLRNESKGETARDFVHEYENCMYTRQLYYMTGACSSICWVYTCDEIPH